MNKILLSLCLLVTTAAPASEISIPRAPRGENPRQGPGIPRTPPTLGNGGGIGVPRGEIERRLAHEVSTLSGLIRDDSRYVSALTLCAQNDAQFTRYLREVIGHLKSPDFRNLPKGERAQEILTLRIALKMECGPEIRSAGIDP